MTRIISVSGLFQIIARCGIAALLALLVLSPTAAQEPTDVQDTVLTVTPAPRPLPTAVVTEGNATLELLFEGIPQGQVGVVHVTGDGIAGARARFLNRLVDFFPMDGDGFYGLLSVSMEQSPRTYDLDVFVWYDDTTRTTLRAQVVVPVGDFIRQTVTIPPDKAFLIDPELERAELARLESIDGNVSAERLWNGFQLPLPSTLTSPFGAFRTFNQAVETRHTGWDMRSTLGMPVMASAAGEVAYAGWMEIRGNYVMLDHGYGVYSGYAHLSQIHVTRGQTVTEGQILGTTGNTGRTSGPHFHWEIAVNGEWVDAVRFLEMWKPG
jgi:hypothetical protein